MLVMGARGGEWRREGLGEGLGRGGQAAVGVRGGCSARAGGAPMPAATPV